MLAVAATGGAGAAVAGAGTAMTMVPLDNQTKDCDLVTATYDLTYGSASGFVDVGAPDSGSVRAEVHMQTAIPDTTYQVRLVQEPHSLAVPCDAGDAGVTTGVMYIDDLGNGSTTVTSPRMPGATGAGVFVEGPPRPGRLHGDIYTSSYIAAI
ncbi:hypothetical protein BTO20_34375 [Mycobacterium dioxanotrophicus]|uniref:Uncharacterized protein n=1 Tax=Mycobacterium dioxanotrophicus TaxID=482462 RepID=A0A1Y0CD52_9MYCO|nr:hypothetical protein [Mycobacterium dioxanotrophicus]ART72967.1 hypothetical protein BTO20_34375 [Mycobacterium dioxanotrophicus]